MLMLSPTRPSGERRLRSEEHTSELQSHSDLVCRLLLEKKKTRHATDCHAPMDASVLARTYRGICWRARFLRVVERVIGNSYELEATHVQNQTLETRQTR